VFIMKKNYPSNFPYCLNFFGELIYLIK